MQISPRSIATVVLRWKDVGGPNRSAVVQLTTEGIELDAVVDVLVAGCESSTEPVYTVEVADIEERTTRRAKRTARVPVAGAAGEPDVAAIPPQLDRDARKPR